MTTARPTISRAELAAYIASQGFQPVQGRIGVEVYRDKPGRRAKYELTVTAGAAFVYDLTKGRRLSQSWSLS
jgi:hypothetical protein